MLFIKNQQSLLTPQGHKHKIESISRFAELGLGMVVPKEHSNHCISW